MKARLAGLERKCARLVEPPDFRLPILSFRFSIYEEGKREMYSLKWQWLLITVVMALGVAMAGCAAQTPAPPIEKPTPSRVGGAVTAGLPPIATLPVQLPAAEFQSAFLIGTEELAGLLAQPEIVIIDGRPAEEYQKAHLPGAINLRWTDLRDYEVVVKTGLHLTPQQAEEIFGKAGIDSKTRVVVYDDGAGRNANGIVFVLYLFGHEQAQMLDGGIRKWAAEGRAVTTEIPKVEKKTFSARPRTDLTVTLDWLTKNKSRADVLIVDPRDFGEYVGMDTITAWPANARAGHIPGAIPLPWTDLGGALETYKSPQVMQYLLREAGITVLIR